MSRNKLAGIITVCTVAVIVTIVLVIPRATTSPEEALAKRVIEWSDLLSSVHMLTEEQAVQEIESFLEPSAARPAKAREFYSARAEEGDWEDRGTSVDDVSIDATGLRATVRLTSLLEWVGEDIALIGPGDTVIVTQILKWRLVDKVWYRTMEPAEVTIGDIVPADSEPEPETSPDPEPDPTPVSTTELTHITIGSHKDDVLRIQGEPDGVDYREVDEWWWYGGGNDYIIFNPRTDRVISWSNRFGSLNAKVLVSDKNVTDATHITIGSHKDDVFRIQGEPDAVNYREVDEWWWYGGGDDYIIFDPRTDRVTSWSNRHGSLKVGAI